MSGEHMIEKIKETIVECLKEDLAKYPDGLGLMYTILRRKAESKISDSMFSATISFPAKIFCRALNELVVEQKILIFGAIRNGFVTFVLKTD